MGRWEGREREKGVDKCEEGGRVVEMSEYKCPLCNSVLVGMVGCKGHENDSNYGYSLFCLNRGCPAQECMGHGNKEKDAYEVIMAKFVRKKD